jgi:GT2 family glycosyltransferase
MSEGQQDRAGRAVAGLKSPVAAPDTPRVSVPVSVVIVAYGTSPGLLPCVASVWADQPGWEVIVVDNGAGGEELEAVAAAGRVTVVSPPGNLGFAGGCNLGAKLAHGATLVFLNPDTVVAPGSLQPLVDPLMDLDVGIVTGRLRITETPELLHAAGTVVHWSGMGWSSGFGTSADEPGGTVDVTTPCGAAMAMTAATFDDLGGFHDEFFLYHEDVQLGWRAQMSGRRVVYCPAADIYHDYDFERHPRKRYFMERNRIAFIGTCFSARTLLLLSPLLLATELAMLVMALRQGWFRDKLAGWVWLARNSRKLLRRRRETQRSRVVRDRDLAWLLTTAIDPGMLRVPKLVKALNPLVLAYWAVVRFAL